MNFDCPPGCGGCSCHISPPCSHCTEHGISEEDGGAPELCLDELGDPVKPVGAHPPLVPPTETTLDELAHWHRERQLQDWKEACQGPCFYPPGSPGAMVQGLAVELKNQEHSLHEAHQAIGRGSAARQVLAASVEKLQQLHVYHNNEFLRVDRITTDHNRQIHNALASVAELQRKVEVLEHQHEEWACHIELVRQAQKAQADRVLDALATLAADASTVANLVKRLDILEEECLPRPSECDL